MLVIEDDEDLRGLTTNVLRRAGFSVLAAESATAGLAVARARRPDVIVLDVRLPDGSGREVCRRLRADPRTADLHLILASGLGEERDRVAGFEAGADDYLSKPYSVRELVLRVRAVTRRLQARTPPPPPPKGRARPPVPVRIDDEAHRVYVGEAEIELTLTEYRLLAYLVSNAGRLCLRSELLQKVWDMPPHLNTRTVDTHVKRVRNKLGEAAACIETVRGAGYRYQWGG